jgi:flagellar biosynthesis component FlhA
VQLGSGLIPGDTSESWVVFRTLLPAMRKRLQRTTGILVPGVRVRRGADLPLDGYAIWIEDVPAASGRTSALPESSDDERGLVEVVAALEEALTDNLPRLLGPDDIRTWAAGAEQADDPALFGDREARLGTHRLLRSLLRERVPLTDRSGVLAAVAAGLAEDQAGSPRALVTVRQRLREALPGVAGGAVSHLLPPHLEERLAAGLRVPEAPAPPTWQLSREEAADLVAAVRAWHAGLDGGETAPIRVRDPLLRSFLWRMLSAGPERVPVVAASETGRSSEAPAGGRKSQDVVV